MPFFSGGGLGGYTPSPSSGLDPQLIQALMSQFPQLAQQQQGQGAQQQQPNALQGYTWPGIQFSPGQGTPQSLGNLSPFEGAKGFGSESITAGLALGNYGKSSSQAPQPGGANPFSLGQLSLPSLALPQAVAAQQGGFGEGDLGAVGGEAAPAEGGITIGASDVLGAGQKALDFFAGGEVQPASGQGAGNVQASERDYSNATGSPSGLPLPISSAPGGNVAGFGAGATPSLSDIFGGGSETTTQIGSPGTGGISTGGIGPTPFSGDTGIFGDSPTMFAPGGASAQDILGAAPGATDWLGVGQGAAGALGGLANVYGGIQGGNIGGAAMGGLQTLGGLTTALQSSPQVLSSIASELGVGAEGLSAGLGAVGGAVGGIGGLYSLYQGIQSGDPMQIVSGLVSAYAGGSALAGSLLGTSIAPVSSLLATVAPQATAAALSALTGTTVAATTTGISAGISAAAGAVALPAAAVLAIVMSAIQSQEEQNMRSSGWWNNPIKGQLYSDATAGVKGTNDLLASLGSDLTGKDTYELGQALTSGVNSLLPYYQTAQGGRNAIRASDTVTGGGGDSQSTPYTGDGASPEQYTANYSQAQQGIVGLVNELMKRGVSYEQLGQLPVTGDWTGLSLDAGNRPDEMLTKSPRSAELSAEASGLFGTLGLNPYSGAAAAGAPERALDTGAWQGTGTKGPQEQIAELLNLSLGASMAGSDKDTKASGLMTDMYGGPLWTALARMGVQDPTLQGLMAQNFDPWTTARQPEFQQMWTKPQLTQEDLDRYRAQQGVDYVAPATPQFKSRAELAGAQDFWGPLGQQYAQKNDPMTQQLAQYIQQLQGLQGGLGQVTQGLQQQETAGLDPGVLQALQAQMGGAPSNGAGGGGGIDLQALLKQLGLAA